jgi:hypothetical protein
MRYMVTQAYIEKKEMEFNDGSMSVNDFDDIVILELLENDEYRRRVRPRGW